MTTNPITPDPPAATPTTAAASPPARRPWRALFLLFGTLLLTGAILLVPLDVLEQLGDFGYLGVFLLTLFSSASIVLPSPALGAALAGGAVLNPWIVGVLAGIAAGLGESTGYAAGYSGSGLAMRSRFYARVESWVRRWSMLTVFVLAAIPSPLIDLAGIAAGTLRLPFRAYLLACLAGKIVRFVPVAMAGRLLKDVLF